MISSQVGADKAYARRIAKQRRVLEAYGALFRQSQALASHAAKYGLAIARLGVTGSIVGCVTSDGVMHGETWPSEFLAELVESGLVRPAAHGRMRLTPEAAAALSHPLPDTGA